MKCFLLLLQSPCVFETGKLEKKSKTFLDFFSENIEKPGKPKNENRKMCNPDLEKILHAFPQSLEPMC